MKKRRARTIKRKTRARRNPYRKSKYTYKRKASKRKFDKRSFRTVRRGKTLVRIGCPKGQWQSRKRRCQVGTRAFEILTQKKRK